MSNRTETIRTVLVYGATGEQARPVVRRLLDAGFAVRAVSRDPERTRSLVDPRAELVAADLADLPRLREVSAGIDGVFMLLPLVATRLDFARNVLDAASAAAVKLLIWDTTGVIWRARTGDPMLDARLDILEFIENSAIPHIILQPTVYMENFLMPWVVSEVVSDDVVAYPIPPVAIAQWVTHEDVAAYAVEAFRRPELANATFTLSGPQHLDGDGIAASFSRGLKRSISFRSMPPQEFGEHYDRATGSSNGAGAAVAAGYEKIFENPTALSTDVDVASLTAQLPIAPTTFEAWVRIHAQTFTTG